ncbi:hypothetical protein [Stenotrophomonas sp.]|uniref:hypothetical protein n=1 Tax=Stenotrophomonas sp. TaxID=69392 RepID=UPI0028AC54A5|nr:hypothetical protein [Stenotrophomonas sp.]
MKKPAWVRTRVEDELRSDFKGVLKRTHYAPAEAIRLFMRRMVEIGQDAAAVDRAQSRRAILNASDHVADALCIGQSAPPGEDHGCSKDHPAQAHCASSAKECP